MKLYIAGPMSGQPDHNVPAFNEAEARLVRAGYQVCNPAGGPVRESWEAYLRHDLAVMLGCDGVAFLPGSWYSRGASLELLVAGRTGIRVAPVNAWALLAEAQARV